MMKARAYPETLVALKEHCSSQSLETCREQGKIQVSPEVMEIIQSFPEHPNKIQRLSPEDPSDTETTD